ncbi:outer membrane beta-barrel family protein, partial [Apibacter mensalis]|uniref:outer membrane beta-barrel family protein n=1 Tax=Apibacter mensalis TaxID=1586267 RepID=UPI001C86BC49
QDSILNSTVLEEDGFFAFSHLSPGNYTIEVKHWGKIVYAKNWDLKEDIDLGEIKVAVEKEIQQVTVTGNKKLIERKVDRMVFNVENSVFSSGGDVLDLLKVTPRVKVVNDQIELIGKSSLKVMVNDRLIPLSGDDLVNYLKSISSADVKNIEVITTPPAQYEAEGNSGLINIQLKKAKKDSWSSTIRTSYQQGFYGYGRAGGNFNYNKKKLTLGVSANYGNGLSQGIEKRKVFYPSQLWNEKDVGKYYENSVNSRFVVDYQLTPKWNTGIQYLINYSNPHSNSNDQTRLCAYGKKLDSLLQTHNHQESISRLNSVNGYSHFAIDSLGRKLKVNFDYFNYNKENEINYFTNTYDDTMKRIYSYFPVENRGTLEINNYSGKVDMEYPMKNIKLEYGTKVSFTKTESGLKNSRLKNGNSESTNKDNFNYTENTQAVYISVNKELKKWDFKAGLRMENTQTCGNSKITHQKNKNNYVKLFPTFYALYKANDNNSYSLSYSRRIERPDYNSVNPFRYYSNPYSYSEGNPFLKPILSHNIEFSYDYKGMLQSTFYYLIIKDSYSLLTRIDENNYIQYTKSENYFNTSAYAIYERFSYNKLKWLQASVGAIGQYLYTKSQAYPVTPKSQEGFYVQFETTNAFVFDEQQNYSSGFTYYYSTPSKSGDIGNGKEKNQLDLFFKAQVFNKKMQISLNINNILKDYDYRVIKIRNGIKSYNRGYYDSRYIRLSLSYKLGSSTIKTKNIEESNAEEKNRIH